MSNSVGTAYITLVPKCDTSTLAKEGERAGQSFGSSFSGKLATAAKVGVAAMAATVAGVGLAANAFKNAINATAEYGDNVDKMSQKIGISAQSYQQWSYVMERAGTSIDSMQAGMKNLSTQAQNNATEFQRLGISQQEVASLSKEDLFGRVIEGLSGMEDGTERTVLATKLLGKSATDLGPLLNQGSDAIKEQMEIAQKYGMVMSDEAVKASADFKDSMTTLTGAIRGAKNAMMGEFLPSVTKMTDGLTKIITGDIDEGIEDIASGVEEMIEKISDAAPKFLEAGKKIVTKMLDGLNDKMPDIVNGLANLIKKLISNIPKYLPTIMSAAVKLFMGIVQAIPSILSSLLSALGSLIGSGVSKVSGSVGQMLSAGAAFIGGLISAIGGAVGGVLSSIGSVITQGVEKAKSFVSDMMSAGKNLVDGIAKGIGNAIGSVASSIGSVAQTIIDKITGVTRASDGWGKDICSGISGGMSSFLWKVRNSVDSVANEISSKLHFSEPDKGPLSNFHTFMPDMMKLMAQGIASNRHLVDEQIDSLTGSIADRMSLSSSVDFSGRTSAADVVGAIDMLHKDLYGIIKDATPDGITGRQFGRLVHRYA